MAKKTVENADVQESPKEDMSWVQEEMKNNPVYHRLVKLGKEVSQAQKPSK